MLFELYEVILLLVYINEYHVRSVGNFNFTLFCWASILINVKLDFEIVEVIYIIIMGVKVLLTDEHA